MKELEQARQRIEEQQRIFDSAKPQLFQLENQVLENLSPRVTTIFQETRQYIEKEVNLPVCDSIQFWFGFRDYSRDRNTRLVHIVTRETEGQRTDEWKLKNRHDKVKEATIKYKGNDDYVVTPYFWVENRSLRGFVQDMDLQTIDWVKENIKVNEVLFHFWSQEEPFEEKHIVNLWFRYNPEAGTVSYDDKIEHLGDETAFGVGTNAGVSSLAEYIFLYLEAGKYKDANVLQKEQLKKDLPVVINTAISTVIVTGQENDDIRNRIDQLNEDRWRGMQTEEREKVLLEIRRREAENPDYHRPGWISQDAFLYGDSRKTQTDRDRFSSDDNFLSAQNRQFPPPRENG